MEEKLLYIPLMSLFVFGILCPSTLGISTHQVSVDQTISQYIAVIPERTVNETLTTGKNYTVAILTDYSGDDVYSCNVQLVFSPAILECIEVRNGDLITTDKDPDARFVSNINNTKGELSAGAFFYYIPPDLPPTTSGPGTLANVTFKVVGTGASDIALGRETNLKGYDATTDQIFTIIDRISPDINHLLSGYFSNTLSQVVDVAVVSVTLLSTSVTKGEPVNITVVVENRGTSDQAFDVKAYYDYTREFPGQNVIGTKTAQTLAAGTSKTLVFTWNTTLVKEGSYTITAVISGLQGDVDLANNELNSSERVTVKQEEIRPLPITEMVIGLVIVVAVVAVIYLVLRKRRKKPQIE